MSDAFTNVQLAYIYCKEQLYSLNMDIKIFLTTKEKSSGLELIAYTGPTRLLLQSFMKKRRELSRVADLSLLSGALELTLEAGGESMQGSRGRPCL